MLSFWFVLVQIVLKVGNISCMYCLVIHVMFFYLIYFTVFKDESKDVKKKKKGAERNKTPVSASVKCYFVRFDSIATCGGDEPYILSSLKVNEARSLFMHVHMVSSLAKYVAR